MVGNETTFDDEDHGATDSGLAHLRPVLMIFDSNKLHEWYLIVQKQTSIGRDNDCDIPLNDETVSRRHAFINFDNIDRPNEDPTCSLTDGESRNGTYINGKRVSGTVKLRNGDRIFIGGVCLAYFVRTELEINSDQKLRSMATTDSLTGLINRGYMAIQFQREFDRSRRYTRPLSILMVDIDDFKKINDTYGHPVGDQVIEDLARILLGKTRIHDLCARYGGEEFAVMLPETTSQGALVIAERLRKTIANHDFNIGQSHIKLTTSIGIADFDPALHNRMEALLEHADQALLRAKRSGKNQVCVYGDETTAMQAFD